MRLLICIPLLLAACSTSGDDVQSSSAIQVAGKLENGKLNEASGLARSVQHPETLWAINDDGPAVVHAMDHTGKKRGQVRIINAMNTDWEDIGSFTHDGLPYLVVADIGDNESKRESVNLYVIAEPDPADDDVAIAWRINFKYPDGPRDAESLSVDAAGQHIYVLSKRDIPAVLYRLPLLPGSEETVVATRVAEIDNLPQPTRRQQKNAAGSGWAWQPTGMDFSADGRSALILTYAGVYFFLRAGDQAWHEALSGPALELKLGKYKDAESITFDPGGKSAFVTVEKKHAPLLKIDLGTAANPEQPSVTIMTFNVENLFDTLDDPGKDDKAYLPIEDKQRAAHIAECEEIEVASWRNDCLQLDWNDAVVAHKLSVLAATILQLNDGRGADVIAFQEVENAAILDRLRLEYLAEAEYGPAILIEGDDSRGIDVAFLSRLPLTGAATLHPLLIEGFGARIGDTRGVLQASFELPDGSTLTGFSVHFPAPYHPTGMRVAAYEHLNKLRNNLPDDHHVFAAGDFNTTSGENQRVDLLGRFARPLWTVAHDSCTDCPGTHYYGRDKNWSFLDIILYSPARGEKTTWGIRADSVQIVNRTDAQVQPPGIPLRYDAARKAGVSDHWPLAVTIELTQKQ